MLFPVADALAEPSWNVTAYWTATIPAGVSLFGDPLLENSSANNLDFLNSIWETPGNTPNGTTIQLWDSATGQYSSPSTFVATYDPTSEEWSGAWTINYDLAPGVGAKITAPASFTTLFIGAVVQPTWYANPPVPGGFDPNTGEWDVEPPGGAGTYLLSFVWPSALPVTDPGENGLPAAFASTFEAVVGRDPLPGESVTRLDPDTQQNFTTTYEGGTTWSAGAPALNPGEAAFFTLVPEPGTLALLATAGVGLLAVVWRRCRSRR
jgi:hypothetical protein